MATKSPSVAAPAALMVGLDVGSTTVKAVCVDPAERRILWSDYQRRESRQAEKAFQLLVDLTKALGLDPGNNNRIFVTGSGAKTLTEPLGAEFVQEVNAVTLAVESLHPDVGSVIELGGQDAKIIIFKTNPDTGEKQPVCSMNDKCASGTGATNDKCLIKVGMSHEELARVRFDSPKLHKVAAKCGVFAETDIVNLVKSGIPSAEVICLLEDADSGDMETTRAPLSSGRSIGGVDRPPTKFPVLCRLRRGALRDGASVTFRSLQRHRSVGGLH